MKTVLKIVGVVLLLTITGWLIRVVFFPAHIVDKAIDTAYGVVDKTLNADNVIYNYEWFKNQYNSYLQMVRNYQNTRADLENFEKTAGARDKWSFATTNEHDRLASIVSGYRNQVQDVIKDYNAKSQMANREIFKTKDLPEQLPLEF